MGIPQLFPFWEATLVGILQLFSYGRLPWWVYTTIRVLGGYPGGINLYYSLSGRLPWWV